MSFLRTLCLPLVALAAFLAPAVPAQTSLLVRVPSAEPGALAQELTAAGFDVLDGLSDASSIQLIITPSEEQALRDLGLTLEVLQRGRPYRDILAEQAAAAGPDAPPPAGYLDLTQINAQMQAYATTYPTLCKLFDLNAALGTPATFEGRHIMALKISDNVTAEEDEPNVLLVSAHHCRELVTPVIALNAVDRLLTDYGTVPAATNAVDNHEIWVVPVWNVDGYEYVFSTDNFWRKNRRVFPTGVGVDLNRNYPHGWTAACSGSTSVGSETYKGPSAASEPETLTMLALSEARNFERVMDYHSSGKEALWGYACLAHPLAAYLQAKAVAWSVASGYGGSERPPSAEGEHYEWQLGKKGALAMLLETATQFQPTYASAQAEAALVWPGILWMLEQRASVSGHVRDACTGLPVNARVTVPALSYSNGETNTAAGPYGRYHQYLPDGAWTLNFANPGYVTQAVPVTVVGGTTFVADVALQPVVPRGCWEDVGGGTTGIAGAPALAGMGTLAGGSTATLTLTNAPPSALMLAWLSLTSVPVNFFGGTIHANPFTSQFLFAADTFGSRVLSTTWPGGVAPGTEVWFQFLIQDLSVIWDITLSNGVKATTP